MGYLTPAGGFEIIADGLERGYSHREIIETILQSAETEAKRVFKVNGFAPDFPDLPSDTTKAEIQEFKRLHWLNEARHIEGSGFFVIEQAAIVLLEADAIRLYIDRGETTSAVLSAFNLLSCGLLPADHKKNLEFIRLPKRLQKRRGKTGGENKAGYINPFKKYIEQCCKEYRLDELTPKQAAARIVKLFQDEEEQEPYHSGEICPIVVVAFDRDTQTLSYSETGRPDKKVELKNFEQITRIIRDLRKANPKKTK